MTAPERLEIAIRQMMGSRGSSVSWACVNICGQPALSKGDEPGKCEWPYSGQKQEETHRSESFAFFSPSGPACPFLRPGCCLWGGNRAGRLGFPGRQSSEAGRSIGEQQGQSSYSVKVGGPELAGQEDAVYTVK